MGSNEPDPSFHHRLGHLLKAVESDNFWPLLAVFLQESVLFNSWVVLIFRKAHAPLLVHEGETDAVQDELFGSYLRARFVDDPFYKFAMTPFSPGLYRLEDVAAPQFRLSSYFRRYFRRNVIADEMQFLTPFGKEDERHGVLSLSLGSRERFSDEDHGRLSLMSSWLLPLISMAARHTLGDIRLPVDRPARVSAVMLEERLRLFGGSRLTEREAQTARLMLSGQNTKAIAAHLGISPQTAKVHRRNLYEKLGISSQAEFFARYLNG